MSADGKRMIENSDRGITLNKQLAWGMLCVIVSLVWYGGSTVQGLRAATENLDKATAEIRVTASDDRRSNNLLADRVRILESNQSRQEAVNEALKLSVEEVKVAQRETNSLLRQLIEGQRK